MLKLFKVFEPLFEALFLHIFVIPEPKTKGAGWASGNATIIFLH